MTDLKWDYKLKNDQRRNPVVYSEEITLSEKIKVPNQTTLLKVFKSVGYTLQTWNRKLDSKGVEVLENDPHWIAVRKSTPLHHDPKYPRYSHHLKVRVDPEIYVRGLDKVELELKRGLFYILDTHSPHQIISKTKYSIWNVAASIDSSIILDVTETKNRLINYLESTSVDTGIL